MLPKNSSSKPEFSNLTFEELLELFGDLCAEGTYENLDGDEIMQIANITEQARNELLKRYEEKGV